MMTDLIFGLIALFWLAYAVWAGVNLDRQYWR